MEAHPQAVLHAAPAAGEAAAAAAEAASVAAEATAVAAASEEAVTAEAEVSAEDTADAGSRILHKQFYTNIL